MSDVNEAAFLDQGGSDERSVPESLQSILWIIYQYDQKNNFKKEKLVKAIKNVNGYCTGAFNFACTYIYILVHRQN